MRELTVELSGPIGAASLASALRDAVTRGRLCGGTPLPSTRTLARDLGVSRGVVVEAYQRLVAEGRLVTRAGSGTAVAASASVSWLPKPPPTRPPATRWPLRPGVPDLGLFPHRAWRAAGERAFASLTDADLDYPDPAGTPRLRARLCSYLGRVRAARVEPDDLAVTSGAAQAFSLLAKTLSAAGARGIGVENPGAPAVWSHFVRCGLTPVPVPVDGEGLDVAALESSGVSAVFVTPAHQFPTGAVLSPRRRTALIEWAQRTGGTIIEDDYDAEFRYDRDPVGCVQGVAPEVTALVGSVSKVLAPALRLGWVCVPPALAGAMAEARRATDLGSSVLPQLTFAELLERGEYERHIRRARRTYRIRRDAVVAALRQRLPAAEITGIAAGLHLLVRFPDRVDDRAVVERAAGANLGPLALSDSYQDSEAAAPGLIVGYAGHSPNELTNAVERLASFVPAAGAPKARSCHVEVSSPV